MATSSNPQSRDIDIDTLIQSLPACKRCRDCRRGCDTLLPKCRQCTKANVECVFYDHGRNEFLPRSYIAQLVDHVRRITPSTAAPGSQSSPATSGTFGETPQDSSVATINSASTVHAESVAGEQQHFDHHFAYAGGSYRYLGAESCLVKSPRLGQSTVQSPVIPDDEEWNLVWGGSASKTYELVQTYLNVLQPLYPILDINARFLSAEVPTDLTAIENFTLNMIYSIACYLEPSSKRRHPTDPRFHWKTDGKLDFHHFCSEKYRCLAETFFKRSQEYLESSTNHTTIATLRAVLLMAIHSLFEPKDGNIGQQVALATRLALDLEEKLEKQEIASEDAEMIRNMHSAIFCLENEIASTLDRPATFPEPDWPLSFTTERPWDYLCSLYRLQHRFRKGDNSVIALIPLLDDRDRLMPGLRMALHQTHLLLNPCWQCAFYFLEAVVSNGCVHVFLTPHWVYRAGCVLIQNMNHVLDSNLVQLYANALVVLELSSTMWPGMSVLRDSLGDIMEYYKSKHRTPWEKPTVHYDKQMCDYRANQPIRPAPASSTERPTEQA